MAEVAEIKKRSPTIEAGRVKLSEFERQDWVATAEVGTAKEDLLDPAYWSHVAQRMKPCDRIEVRIDDGSWMAELYVLDCGRTWVKCYVLQFYQFTKISMETPSSKYTAKWKGPHHKWAVIRNSDSEMISREHSSEEVANAWIKQHERVTE